MTDKTASNVDRITDELRQMAAAFLIKPEERIREGAMAERLKVSRTPLREALNRLVSEGFLTFTSGQGFFCRSLTPERILDLYEARAAVECEAMRLSIARATDYDFAQLTTQLDADEPHYTADQNRLRLLNMDESFHLALARLSRNDELVRMLDNINGRIRYVRMMSFDMIRQSEVKTGTARLHAHRDILSALTARDETRALAELRAHISLRKEDAVQAVRQAFSHIYVEAG